MASEYKNDIALHLIDMTMYIYTFHLNQLPLITATMLVSATVTMKVIQLCPVVNK